MGAGSVAAACRKALEGGLVPNIDYVGEYRVDWTNALEEGVENPVIHSTFRYAAQLVIADSETGKIETVVAVHDVGRAINPTLCEGQIEGAVHMGLGYALTEDFPTDETAMPTNMTLRQLGILRPKDIPDIEVQLVEVPQRSLRTASRVWGRSALFPPPAQWRRPCMRSMANGGPPPDEPCSTVRAAISGLLSWHSACTRRPSTEPNSDLER